MRQLKQKENKQPQEREKQNGYGLMVYGFKIGKRTTYQKVFAGRSNGSNDIDLLHQEQVDNDLAEGVQDDAGEDGDGARGLVVVVGLDQHGGHEGEGPGDQVERDDEAACIVDGRQACPCGLAPKEQGHDRDTC